LNWIGSKDEVTILAELGVALLLFTVGLEFSFSHLRLLGWAALGGGAVQVVATVGIAALICLAVGVAPGQAVALGAMIALSSTACVLRVLADRAESESIHGRSALGILLVQDIAVIPLVILITTLGGGGTAQTAGIEIVRAAVGIALLALGFLAICNYLLPRLLDADALAKNRELAIILAVVTCLGASWAAHAIKLSPAIGAFVAGMLLAESPFATQIRADLSALRTLFVALFFTSMGMLADPRWVWNHWPLVIATVGAIVLGKSVIIWIVARGFGQTHRNAIATGICLAQIGEFSTVLAGIAVSPRFKVIEPGQFQLVISTVLITLLLTSYLVALAPRFGHRVEQMLLPRIRRRDAHVDTSSREPNVGHCVVVGFGPAGRQVVEALRQSTIDVVVVDQNRRMIEEARSQGVPAHVGDASRPEVLHKLDVVTARYVVVTIPDHRASQDIVRQVRAVAPQATVVARARYHRYAGEFASAGAHSVIDEEWEIGRLLGLQIRRYLDEPHQQ
jgi:CPA2 family monovalent cation:H+ antiporter-2